MCNYPLRNVSFLSDLKMTTQRKKKKKMMRKRRSTTVKSPSQSWSHGVAAAWSGTLVFVSFLGKTAVRRRKMRKTTSEDSMTGRTVIQMIRWPTKRKTLTKRMSPHSVSGG